MNKTVSLRFLLALTVATSVVSFTTRGATTWTGAVGSDWSTAGNWNPGIVPASTIDVTLPAGADVSVAPGVSAAAASITVSGVGAVSLALGDGASLAVGGDFTVTGTVACALSGGTVSMGGTLACGYASTGTVMTVQKTVLTAGDLLVGCWAGGSQDLFVITNGAFVTLAGKAVVGLGCSTEAPASSNRLLVAQGGVLVVPTAYVAMDTNAVARVWENNLVVDGGIVTNTGITHVSYATYASSVLGCLMVKNGGFFYNSQSSAMTSAIDVRAGKNRGSARGGVVVLDGGRIQTGGRLSYPDYTGPVAETPFFAITNGTAVFGSPIWYYNGCHITVAGENAMLDSASAFKPMGGIAIDVVFPSTGWTKAPIRFAYSDVTATPGHLTIDASKYVGDVSTNIPIFEASKSKSTVPTNFLTDTTIVLPSSKWQGEFVFNTASNIVYLALTPPHRGFVIHICDDDIAVPYSWISNNCASVVDSGNAAISNALVSSGVNGLKRWESYALGLDPNSASSVVLCDMKQDGVSSAVTFFARNALPATNDAFTVVYSLEGSADGATWPFLLTSKTNAISLPLPSSYSFFRLRTDIIVE